MKCQIVKVNELESMSLSSITTTEKLSNFACVYCSRTTALKARISNLIYAIADPQREGKAP